MHDILAGTLSSFIDSLLVPYGEMATTDRFVRSFISNEYFIEVP